MSQEPNIEAQAKAFWKDLVSKLDLFSLVVGLTLGVVVAKIFL